MPRTRQYADANERQRAYRERKSRSLRNGEALRNDKRAIKVDRPPVRYYGSKWKLAEWIVACTPPHDCYVEAFCGGASVLFNKPAAPVEVINDLDSNVINFFDLLRSRPGDLIHAIQCTPYARAEWERAADQVDDPLEKARRFYVRCWQSFTSTQGDISPGWRFQKDGGRANAVKSWNQTDHLWQVANRLKGVFIERDDAFKVIRRFDGPKTLFYLDPPYVAATRSPKWARSGYRFEMSDDDHRSLAAMLHQVQGMVIISGYPSALYDELFADWKCISCQTRDQALGIQTECLWLSPSAVSMNSLPLFAGIEVANAPAT